MEGKVVKGTLEQRLMHDKCSHIEAQPEADWGDTAALDRERCNSLDWATRGQDGGRFLYEANRQYESWQGTRTRQELGPWRNLTIECGKVRRVRRETGSRVVIPGQRRAVGTRRERTETQHWSGRASAQYNSTRGLTAPPAGRGYSRGISH